MLRGVAPLMDYKPGDVLFGEYNLTSFMGVQLSNDHNFSERELSSLLALAERPAEPPASALQLGELLGEPFGRKNIGGRKNTGRPAHRRLRRGPPGPQRRHGVPAAGAHAPGEAGGPNKGRRAGPQQPVKTDNMVLGRPVPLYRPPTPTGYSIPGSGPQGFLGSGNFGDVWRAKKGNQRVVLKFMVDPTTRLHSTGRQASPDAKKEYSNDCEVPRLIQHAVRNNGRLAPYARHFAKCFASTAGNDPNYQDQPVYVALEDAGDGCKDLNGWVPKNVNEPYRITPSSMKNFAQQLLEALALVHHVGVVHQDTKPENIMITARGVLWLVDFGRANRLDHQEDQTFFGDGGWMGPEASQQPFTTSPGVDMWSAGLTFLFMFTGGNFFKLGPGFPPVNLANGGWAQTPEHTSSEPPIFDTVKMRPMLLLALMLSQCPHEVGSVSFTKRTSELHQGTAAESALGCEGSPMVDASFTGLLPIEWIHIPKTGTSFLNTLRQVPGACPCCPADMGMKYDLFRLGCCNASVFDTKFFENSVHPAIEDLPGGFKAGKGRFMTFMRQPEQRLLSMVAYEDGGRDTESITTPGMTLDDKKVFFGGWMTKMLVRGGNTAKTLSDHDTNFLKHRINFTKKAQFPNLQGETVVEGAAWDQFMKDYGGFLFPLTVSRAEVEEAKARLRKGFSFIGMTSRWNLSVCLFSVMFNQPCRGDQIENVRPSSGDHQTTYDITVLNGWRDPYDNELFDVATEVFEANLKRYNVNDFSCQRCWQEAGVQ